jgi:hypothetical protein
MSSHYYPYKNSPGFLKIDRRKNGYYLRLSYSDQGVHRKRIGPLLLSPAPILESILAADFSRFTLPELYRLRDIDKSWRPIS